MSQSLAGEFPGQELEKSLSNIQALLETAKPLTEKLVLDKKLREAIIKCLEALHALLSEDQNDNIEFEQGIFEKYSPEQIPNKRNEREAKQSKLQELYRKGKITFPELEQELDNLDYE